MKINNIAQNNKNHYKFGFKANICQVDKTKAERIIQGLPNQFEVGRKWIIEEAAVNLPTFYTHPALNCVIGSVINPKTGLGNMFHISPNPSNMDRLDEILSTIYRQTKALQRKPNERLEGLIVGSDGLNMEGKVYQPEWLIENNKKLQSSIKRLFKRMAESLGMDYSTILGRKDSIYCISVATDATHNTHYINLKGTDGIKDLRRLYEDVFISNNDRLLIEKETIH